jgi:hypothetical protein
VGTTPPILDNGGSHHHAGHDWGSRSTDAASRSTRLPAMRYCRCAELADHIVDRVNRAGISDDGDTERPWAVAWGGRPTSHFSVGHGMASWMLVKSRIMYVELKSGHSDDGPAWIGRVTFSKTGRTVYYRGKSLRRASGLSGANHIDMETGEEYWVSGVNPDSSRGCRC